MIHDEVENESMEIDQELIQILELPNEDIETVNIIVFQMFKNTWKTLKKKMQTKLLEMKTTMCKMENTLEGVDSK